MTMTKREALEASIRHWEENVDRARQHERLSIGCGNCALCEKYRFVGVNDHCNGCPVAQRTGHRYCAESPYDYFEFGAYKDDRDIGNWSDIESHAIAELEFLKSLRDDVQDDVKE